MRCTYSSAGNGKS
ncbi:hypothetical protein D043_3181B, partial [Vibrio parahaemolyticus EKP-021]